MSDLNHSMIIIIADIVIDFIFSITGNTNENKGNSECCVNGYGKDSSDQNQ